MKKNVLLVLLLILAFLSSCDKNTISCDDNERLVEGSCLVLTSHEQSLYDTFVHAKTLNNYRMDVSILSDIEEYHMSIYMDDTQSKSVSEDGNRVELYKREEDVCYSKTIYNTVLLEEEESCGKYVDYGFFREFSYQWFELDNGLFHVKDDYLGEATLLVQREFKNAEVEDIMMSSLNDQFSSIILDLVIEERGYRVQMDFSDIGETIVSYDEVN